MSDDDAGTVWDVLIRSCEKNIRRTTRTRWINMGVAIYSAFFVVWDVVTLDGWWRIFFASFQAFCVLLNLWLYRLNQRTRDREYLTIARCRINAERWRQ